VRVYTRFILTMTGRTLGEPGGLPERIASLG
jgi:hypothetical protein